MRTLATHLLGVLAVAGACAASAAQPAISLKADHADHLYTTGQTARVTITATNLKRGTLTAWVDDGWTNCVARRTIDLAHARTLSLALSREEPGTLRLYVKGPNIRTKKDRLVFNRAEIRPFTPCPDDFWSFWQAERARLDREVPIAVQQTPAPKLSTADHTVSYVSFATFNGRRLYGMLAVPKTGTGPYPVCINVPGAGPGAIAPNPLRKGWITLTCNIHGVPIGATRVEHNRRFFAWFKDLTTRTGEPTYQRSGFGYGRDAHFYHDAMLGITRAIDWLAQDPRTDAKRFVYFGCSQGGGYGLYLTALWGRFAKSLILCPAMCDMLAFQHGRQPGSEHIMDQNPPHKAVALTTGPYYDGCNFARQIQTPVRIVSGLGDDDCQCGGVISAFNVIPAKDKALHTLPGVGHGWHTDGLASWVFDVPRR